MTKKKNPLANLSPEPVTGDSGSSAAPAESEPLAPVVETIVETQSAPAGGGFDVSGLIERAAGNVRAGVTGEPPRNKGGRPPKAPAPTKKDVEQFATVIAAGLTLIVGALRIPGDLKPNEDETGGLAVPITNLMLRHLPISGKLTADAMDAIAIVAVVSSYYARTAIAWRDYSDATRARRSAIPPARPVYRTVPEAAHTETERGAVDPIANIDPAAADFLGRPRNGNPN